MFPTSFDESNFNHSPPPGISEDEIGSVASFIGQDLDGRPIIITCWKATKEELNEINRTGRVWCFHYGNLLQPHALSGTNPFGESF